MDETKTVRISYTKFGSDVSRLDELLVIKPENFLCYSESDYSQIIELSLFAIDARTTYALAMSFYGSRVQIEHMPKLYKHIYSCLVISISRYNNPLYA